MKKFGAFILAEQLMTIMLQAGFILVLCGTFYLLTSFYSNINQALTARNHAERVISFVDAKVRHAGLGLWQCENSASIRSHINTIPMLYGDSRYGYTLPVSITENDENMNEDFIPEGTADQNAGNVLTLLYTEREENDEFIMTFVRNIDFSPASNKKSGSATMTFLGDDDGKSAFINNKTGVSFFRVSNKKNNNINRWGVAEAIGLPFFVDAINYPNIKVWFYSDSSLPDTIMIPNGGEIMYLRCMQMFVRSDGDERQFVFRELTEDGKKWKKVGEEDSKGYKYGLQEDNILGIYAKLESNVLTLYVLASGGRNTGANTSRPDAWPKEAEPKGSTNEAAKTAWLESDYCNHIVYVSRQSWRLHNVPN